MPFTAIEEKLELLTAEVAKFNAEAPQLHDDVNRLNKRGMALLIGVVVSVASLVVAVGICFWVIADRSHQDDIDNYRLCARGNELRIAVVDGFGTTLDTVIGPKPAEDAPQELKDRYNRNVTLRDQIVDDLGGGALAPRDCGPDPS